MFRMIAGLAVALVSLGAFAQPDQNTQAGMKEWCDVKFADYSDNVKEACLEDEIISLQTLKSYRNEWNSRDAVNYTINWCRERFLVDYGWDQVLHCLDEELFSYSALLTYQREWNNPQWLADYIELCRRRWVEEYGWDQTLYCVQEDVQSRASLRYGVPRD